MEKRQGFVVKNNEGRMVGCISFSDYIPEQDITIHCFIDPEYHGKWATKSIYNVIFDYAFEHLGVNRVSGFSVVGVTDRAGRFLEALGFKKEGTLRQRIKRTDGFYDVNLYGLLKNERRW